MARIWCPVLVGVVLDAFSEVCHVAARSVVEFSNELVGWDKEEWLVFGFLLLFLGEVGGEDGL